MKGNKLIVACVCLMALSTAVFAKDTNPSAKEVKPSAKDTKSSAKNNQTVVIGRGLGLHVYAETDDTRKGSDSSGGSTDVTLAGELRFFGEWYPFNKFGLGGIFNHLASDRTDSQL